MINTEPYFRSKQLIDPSVICFLANYSPISSQPSLRMQGPGGGRNPFFDFGDPFGGFGGSGSFGPPRSLISSFFGGRNPFDDPFFTRPFGEMFESIPFGGPTGFPFPSSMHPSGFLEHQALGMHPSGFLEHRASGMHPSMFLEQQVLDMNPSGFIERQAPGMHPSRFLDRQAPQPSRHRGPIIEELDSEEPSRPRGSIIQEVDSEEPSGRRGPIIQELDSDNENEDATEKKENPRKHSRSQDEHSVEHPHDEIEGKKSRYLQAGDEYNRFNATGIQPRPRPQSHSFCFQSSTVSYGGPNGTYYTSSRTRRSGNDGVTFEESKEADSSTMQASHRISRGIRGKGHSLSRKLNSDGRVDTMQTLHNINEDELARFEAEWKGKEQRYLPGLTGVIEARGNNGQGEQARQGGWALPSSVHSHPLGTISEAREQAGSSCTQERLRVDSNGRNAYPPGRGGGQN